MRRILLLLAFAGCGRDAVPPQRSSLYGCRAAVACMVGAQMEPPCKGDPHGNGCEDLAAMACRAAIATPGGRALYDAEVACVRDACGRYPSVVAGTGWYYAGDPSVPQDEPAYACVQGALTEGCSGERDACDGDGE